MLFTSAHDIKVSYHTLPCNSITKFSSLLIFLKETGWDIEVEGKKLHKLFLQGLLGLEHCSPWAAWCWRHCNKHKFSRQTCSLALNKTATATISVEKQQQQLALKNNNRFLMADLWKFFRRWGLQNPSSLSPPPLVMSWRNGAKMKIHIEIQNLHECGAEAIQVCEIGRAVALLLASPIKCYWLNNTVLILILRAISR